jgi:hypothetical protein
LSTTAAATATAVAAAKPPLLDLLLLLLDALQRRQQARQSSWILHLQGVRAVVAGPGTAVLRCGPLWLLHALLEARHCL